MALANYSALKPVEKLLERDAIMEKEANCCGESRFNQFNWGDLPELICTKKQQNGKKNQHPRIQFIQNREAQ